MSKKQWLSCWDPLRSIQIAYDNGTLIIPARDAKPPATDEVGNPVWPPEYKMWCKQCYRWQWVGEFHSTTCQKIVCQTCKEEEKTEGNRGAYTHVIKNPRTGEVSKISIAEFDIPEGYVIIKKVRGGQLLPNYLHKVKKYEPDTK